MVKAKKLQKKSFFDVTSSLTAAKISLYAASAEELNGRIVKLDLTRSLRGKGLELKLKVKVEGSNLNSEPISLELAGSYIRRAFRKGADYVEDSLITECKDAKILIKPFMLTRNKVSRAVRRELRNAAREFLISYLKIRTSKELFTDIMTNKVQKELSLKLKKIYPLAFCEIRIFKLLLDPVALKVSEKAEKREEIRAEAEKEAKIEAEIESEEKAEKKISKKAKIEKKE